MEKTAAATLPADKGGRSGFDIVGKKSASSLKKAATSTFSTRSRLTLMSVVADRRRRRPLVCR